MRLCCPSDLLTYPDAQVICGAVEYLDQRRDTVKNPVLIVEVLSKSTERYDRGEKFQFYREILTLKEYVLVSHRAPRVERYVRQLDGGWLLKEAIGLEASADLEAIGCTLPLAEVYLGVEFHSPPPGVFHGDDEP
jgi:Uma2 family endonuclease